MTRLRKVAGVACVGRSPAPYAEAKHSAEVEKWQSVMGGWLQAWLKGHSEGVSGL